jgi:hypothetical protein
MTKRVHQAQLPQENSPKPRWKRILWIVSLAILVPVGIYLLLNLNYLRHIHDLSNQVDKVWQKAVKPVGGVKLGEEARCPQLIDAVLQADAGPCPEYGAAFLVAVAPQDEERFVESALQQTDYTALSKKGLTASAKFFDLGSAKPPYSAPAGTRWRVLDVSFFDTLANFQTIFFPPWY